MTNDDDMKPYTLTLTPTEIHTLFFALDQTRQECENRIDTEYAYKDAAPWDQEARDDLITLNRIARKMNKILGQKETR